MNKKRYAYIDLAKALGMLAVIWGHIHTSGESFVFVYAFDIPLFFFLSGMMFKNEKYDTLWKLVKNRAKTLLLPYVIFSIATWLVWVGYNLVLHNDVNYFAPLLQTVIAQGSGGYLVHNVPLWFVTCLFVVEVLYYFICKLPDIWSVLICAACAGLGYWMLNNSLSFDFTKLPWNIESALSAILFYCLGNLFIKHFKIEAIPNWVQKNKWKSIFSIAVLTVILAIGAIYNGHVSIGSNLLGKNIFVFYAVGLVGTFSTLFFSNLLELPKSNIADRLVGGVKWIGKNSFYFMAVHVPIKGFLIVVLAKLLHVSTGAIASNFFESIIIWIGTLICSFCAVLLINMFKKKFTKKNA